MTRSLVSFLVVLAACGDPPRKVPGPPPDASHQTVVRRQLERVLAAKYELAAPSTYRFAEPVPDRVAAWHWEPQEEGNRHGFGYRHGWRVDCWVTPQYVGYPPQPELRRMAFFADGELRGLFGEGGQGAPLELDRWSPLWVDPGWDASRAPSRPPR